MNKAANDQELRKAAAQFLSAAWAARCKSEEEVKAALESGLGARFLDGAMFTHTVDVRKALAALSRRTIKVLGTKAVHENDIEDAAWKRAVETDGVNSESKAVELIRDLDTLGATTYLCIVPNYAIHFVDAVQNIDVGPVRACLSEDLLTKLGRQNKNTNLEFEISANPGFNFEGKKGKIALARVSWEVKVTASRGNVKEEALWLINIALSLLRLSYPAGRVPTLFPGLGETETYPIRRPETRDRSVIIKEIDDGLFGGGWSAPRIYTINQRLLEHHQQIGFADRTRQIFEHRAKTIGERVAQGLGWMARGRQAEERSERFLFFFTAIEALLSSDDKTAPVIQTIARRAATMLVQNPSHRHDFASNISRQYAVRSALVHGGKRNVSNMEAHDAQLLEEALYWAVLQHVPLDTAIDRFEESLGRCSYGIPWPEQ